MQKSFRLQKRAHFCLLALSPLPLQHRSIGLSATRGVIYLDNMNSGSRLLACCLCFLAYRALSLVRPSVLPPTRGVTATHSAAAPHRARRRGDSLLQLSRFQLNKHNDTAGASTLLQIPAINNMLFNRGAATNIGNNNNNNNNSSLHMNINSTEAALHIGESNSFFANAAVDSPADVSVLTDSINYLTSNKYNSVEYLSKELSVVQKRLEKVEKALGGGLTRSGAGIAAGGIPGTQVSKNLNSVIDSLMFSTIQLNPKTVEVCATAGFFLIGALLGASLLDRLWLLGGLGLAYWASGAVYRDTRGGQICRRVGVQIAQFVRDLQEKYNQAIIFYRTGKLGFYTMSTWDKWDSKYGITPKFDDYKRRVMRRAMDFNTAFQDTKLTTQLQDVVNAITAAPLQAKRLDSKYGVTSKVVGFTRGVWSSSVKGLRSLLSAEGAEGDAVSRQGNEGGGLAALLSGAVATGAQRVSGFVRGKRKELSRRKPGYRGRPINPWSTPFSSMPGAKRGAGKKKRPV